MADAPEYAKCKTCGGQLKHPPLVGYLNEDGTVDRIPSYHQQCVPIDKRAGQQYIRKH